MSDEVFAEITRADGSTCRIPVCTRQHSSLAEAQAAVDAEYERNLRDPLRTFPVGPRFPEGENPDA